MLYKSTAILNENTPATIEADQILLALQQPADNNNSAIFHNNNNRISKLPKSLTTTMLTFDGKSGKFELFEYLFQTGLKIHNQLTEMDRINYFHSLMKGDSLRTFKNINGPTRENLGEILAIFRRNYVKPQSIATAKHKFQKFVFNPENHKIVDFLDDLQKVAKDAFGIAAHAITEQFIYVKMPPHLKKSINQAHLENGTYEQIVTHLEKELELNGLKPLMRYKQKLWVTTLQTQMLKDTNQRATTVKNQDIAEISVNCWKNSENKLKIFKLILETEAVTPIFPTRTATLTIITTTKTETKPKESQKFFIHPVRRVARQTILKRNATTEPMQPIDRLPGKKDRKDKIKSKKKPIKMTGMELFKLQPKN